MSEARPGENGRIRLRQVERRWGAQIALDGIDLELRQGERVALVGPSGSGKSTLLSLVAGALAPSAGQVEIAGQVVGEMTGAQLRKHRASCAIVPQGSQLVPQLSVHRNVVSGLLPGWPWYQVLASTLWPVQRERAERVLSRVGLADRQWELTANLSGGEQQRVAVARALITTPRVVLADEPTAALDPTNARSIANALIDHARDSGATLLICTHWVSLVMGTVDRLIGLREGKVVLDAPANKVDEDDLDELYAGSDELH